MLISLLAGPNENNPKTEWGTGSAP